MDSRELTHWMAFWEVEHLGGPEERADLRTGILGSIVANTQRDPDRTPEPYTATDFLPRFGESDDEWDGSAANVSPEAFSSLLHARFPLAG